MTRHDIDGSFTTLPYRRLAEAALTRAQDFNVSHADFRFERIRSQEIRVRDGRLQGASDSETLGFSVRVVLNGAWGFASGMLLSTQEAVRIAETAVRTAQVAGAMTSRPIELAAEPTYDDVQWVSAYEVDPLTVPLADKVEMLSGWSAALVAAPGVEHSSGSLQQVMENKFYTDLAGTTTTQQRVRLQPELEVHGTNERSGVYDSMRTVAPPVGRGWEYLSEGYDWDTALGELPDLLAEKLLAPPVEAGRYDLVIHPSNLWLTIHESIGHATELDRALGYEASYAGTSFATVDRLNTLQYGSPVMNVTGDRTHPHGLATVGYDDEGVQTQSWDIIKDGVLVGYQLDRPMAQMMPELNGGRSNGCAYADGPGHIPIQRMANVSLQPSSDADGGPSLEDLVSRVERGILVVGDKSWSIDMQRYNFQFTGQRFFLIESGRLRGQVRDVAYQATTTDFWNSLEAVGGPDTWELGGAFNCGKAQPGQTAAVSHGCPTSLFRAVNVLNTTAETGS